MESFYVIAANIDLTMACLMPAFVQEYIKSKKENWTHMRDAAVLQQLETTKTFEEAKLVMEFWKNNFHDALDRHEAVMKPFNGFADSIRTELLNKPLTRLHIDLTDAYLMRPSIEYYAASVVLDMFQPK
jgi:hypothetical protein